LFEIPLVLVFAISVPRSELHRSPTSHGSCDPMRCR
jgi:hypothetical protein